MKSDLVFVSPSVQTAAENILSKKAYKVYSFPVNDGSKPLFPIGEGTFTATASSSPHEPFFKPGSRVCLSYNKKPEVHVVLAVAHGPRRSARIPSTSASASASTDDPSEQLHVASIEDTGVAATVSSPDGVVTAVTEDNSTLGNVKYLYLVTVLHKSSTTKLKDNVDFTQTKVVAQNNLLAPPVFVAGRVLHIPVNKWGKEVVLPVEIKKVERGMGLSVGDISPATKLRALGRAREVGVGVGVTETPRGPEGEVWKYIFVHGTEWLSEDAVVDLVGGDFEGIWS